jgi:hypothetical protein
MLYCSWPECSSTAFDLFPFSVMDLMLALTEDGIHDVMWSDDLLAPVRLDTGGVRHEQQRRHSRRLGLIRPFWY